MKVLVTGGAGFIGSHVVDRLVAEGRPVAVLDNLSTGRMENLNPQAEFFEGDIGGDLCDTLFHEWKPESVIHLAAQIDVRQSVRDPLGDARTNILGSLRVLQNAVEHGCRRVVFASTGGAIYGDTDLRPTPESAECSPVSPYGVTKLAIEKYLHFYRVEHGLRPMAMRFGNVYGPRQNPHGEAGVVAIFCRRMLAGQPAVINGDGLQTRDYVHVEDVARACVLAEASAVDHGIFNVGTGIEKNVVDLFRVLRDELDPGREEAFGPAAVGEQRTSCLDWSHTKQVLGWSPQRGFDEGLRDTARWFRGKES